MAGYYLCPEDNRECGMQTDMRTIHASKSTFHVGHVFVDDFAALAHPEMAFKTRGGVTTCVVGNCGFGAAPYPEAVTMLASLTPGLPIPQYTGYAGYADALATVGPGANIGVLAGHGTIRMASVGSEDREPSDAEMAEMKACLSEALDAGVLGMSTGLIYDPGRYARTEEIAELASLMQGTGALYATHMRDEGAGLLESVNEAIAIGTGRRNPGRDALALAPGPVGDESREGTAAATALGLGPARRSVATGTGGGAPSPARRVASRAVSLCSKMDLLQYKHIHCLKDAQHK